MGVRWRAAVGVERVTTSRNGVVVVIDAVCECVLDLEPDGGAGVVEVMRAPKRETGRDDPLHTTSCQLDTIWRQAHKLTTSKTFVAQK